MTQYWVLGYKNNPLVKSYEDKYYQKLLQISHSLLWENHGVIKLEDELKKQFLLHPDISSLIMDYFYKNNEDSCKKFIKESNYYISWKHSQLTLHKWEKINGTSILLTLDDNNPENGIVWHPDHDQEGMLGWWDKTPKEWNEVFSKSFMLLKNVNPDFYEELNYLIKKIVPMKTSIDVHNSCSYKECVGTLYLWYTTNVEYPELSILEALIHESSHNKLNLIMQSDRLTLNDFSLQYYSPYRPDARHIHWVYLWVHALIPTVYILLQAIESWYIKDSWWMQKTLLYHMKNKIWFKVLQKYAKTTKIGQSILQELADIVKLSDDIITSCNTLTNIDKSETIYRTKKHLLQVKSENPSLQY